VLGLDLVEVLDGLAACLDDRGDDAGPVEELIYIEGPAHYEPATLTDAPWDIKLYGGATREVLTSYPLSDLENAAAIREGRTRVQVSPRLTKLRRVFQPEEMTEDLVFREIDLARWLASTEPVPLTPYEALINRQPDPNEEASFALQLANSAPLRIAQAATQYGRWRDPNGIGPLVAALSAQALDQTRPDEQDRLSRPFPSAGFLSWQGIDKWSWPATKEGWAQHPGCGHLLSCIWALGEIGIEHEMGGEAEAKLLDCARHANQLIRMEAYLALTKMGSQRVGPVLLDRFARLFATPPLDDRWQLDFRVPTAEMDIMADWIARFGTPGQREAFADILGKLIVGMDFCPLSWVFTWYAVPYVGTWQEWVGWQAATTRDQRLIPALEGLRSRLSPDRVPLDAPFLLRAEAACGSMQATATVVQQIIDNEAVVLSEPQIPTRGNATSRDSLRTQVLREGRLSYALFPMPAEVSDQMIRSAMSRQTMSDGYVLYLLTRIAKPEACDRERLMQIWNSRDEGKRLFAIDVLYLWAAPQMLRDLYDQADFDEVRSEIAWALAALKESQDITIIEEQVHDSWNPDWLSLNRPFIHPRTDRRGQPVADYLNEEMMRVEQALWNYFHPAFGVLDEERLAVLKRLAADRTIHAGMRFDLLGVDYGGTEWGLPLLEQAARDILAIDSSPSTIQRIMSMMKSVGNSGFVVGSPSNWGENRHPTLSTSGPCRCLCESSGIRSLCDRWAFKPGRRAGFVVTPGGVILRAFPPRKTPRREDMP